MAETRPDESDAPHAPPPDALIRALPEAVTTTDLTGRITYVSPRTLEMHGYENPEQLLGADAMLLLAPEHREAVAERLRAILTEDVLPVVECEMLRRDGGRFPAELTVAVVRDTDGRPQCLIGITRDITERTAAERALRESEEKFRKVFETSRDAMSLNTADGTIVEVNEAFCLLTGYSGEEVDGRPEAELDLWARPRQRQGILDAVRREGYAENVEIAVRCKDGNVRTALMSANVVTIGGTPHLLAVARDITERRLLLEQAQRDAEIKQNLLHELNHRVKNNLATITSLMYLERSHPTQTKAEFIASCLTRVTSLAELHSILSEQLDKTVEAEPLIRRVTGATVSGALPPLPKVEFELNADGLRLGTDTAGGLAMALSELVANALRHAAPKTEDPELHVCLQEVDGLWHLTVSDNGPGLPEGFDPGRDGGTGLKLVRQIARKQLRGNVFIERRGHRTVAVICFPRPRSTG